MFRPDSYGDADRSYVLPFVPPTCSRVLDIGCGSGMFLQQLKQQRPGVETWGIDVSRPGEHQAERMDKFLPGQFPAVLPDSSFDAVVLNDVVEHLVDPWSALRTASDLLSPGGVVVASIPNVRHYSVIKPLVVNGRFDYKDAGLLDRTHLRFFTFATSRELFRDAGLRVIATELATFTTTGPAARCLQVFGRATQEFRARHIVVVGSRG